MFNIDELNKMENKYEEICNKKFNLTLNGEVSKKELVNKICKQDELSNEIFEMFLKLLCECKKDLI